MINNKFSQIVFENQNLLVVNKKLGIVSSNISPLICHRLDRNTSGLLIIAKNQATKEKIQQQFKNHQIRKKYWALVLGRTELKFEIEGFIFRDKKLSDKRRFVPGFEINDLKISGKSNQRYSKTIFKTLNTNFFPIFSKPSQKDLNYFSLVEAEPITGRTHQIRLHLSNQHHPILGDDLYGGKIVKKINQKLIISRLLLHAVEINFKNPDNGKDINLKSNISSDFQKTISKITKDKQAK